MATMEDHGEESRLYPEVKVANDGLVLSWAGDGTGRRPG